MGESLLAENGPEIGTALGESTGQTMGDILLAENGPEIGPALGESMGSANCLEWQRGECQQPHLRLATVCCQREATIGVC
jgi:hypothetical protein